MYHYVIKDAEKRQAKKCSWFFFQQFFSHNWILACLLVVAMILILKIWRKKMIVEKAAKKQNKNLDTLNLRLANSSSILSSLKQSICSRVYIKNKNCIFKEVLVSMAIMQSSNRWSWVIEHKNRTSPFYASSYHRQRLERLLGSPARNDVPTMHQLISAIRFHLRIFHLPSPFFFETFIYCMKIKWDIFGEH